MKRFLILACALAVSTAAFAQLYKWVDKDGRITYSDQPPPAQTSKQLNISTGAGGPAAATAPPRSAVDRDKELDKGRTEAKEKEKAAADAERKAELARENCNRARSYLRTLTEGGRISYPDANGERALLDDNQIAAERVKAQKAADEACKPS